MTPITLPPALGFSQSSLQDYVDCARRFQLRYVLDQRWPAPPAEPLNEVEQADRLGKQFHLVMQRHWLGLPVDRETLSPSIQPWWDAFLQYPLEGLPGGVRRPEVHTSAVVHGQRMVATFDLLAYEPDEHAVIVDWKTSQRKPARATLDRRWQTIVYPLLLVELSERLLGYQIKPENVRLIYWFANSPSEVERFQYSTVRYERDKATLAALLNRLLAMDMDEVWPLTPNTALCRLCQYRSLCARGSEAGSLDEAQEEAQDDIRIDIDTVESEDFVL